MGKISGEIWGASDAYERYMGRWSRMLAPKFLEWIEADSASNWIDIGCGTGVLSETILETFAPLSVLGVDPSDAFLKAARKQIVDHRFTCVQGSGESLDVEDDLFHFAVSGLVLNFVRDTHQAVSEMLRVLKPGGKAALYVWDYAGHMQIMRYFFDAAAELDIRAQEFDDGFKAPICRPAPLQKLFEDAGLANVSVDALDIPTAFKNFDEYWTPFLAGTGSAPKYFTTLNAEAQAALKAKVQARIPTGPEGEILLAARAWAVQGSKGGK